MTDFTNTIDVVGDEALSDSIIERTITEFKDDHVLTVGHGAFYYCTALTTVDLPEAISAFFAEMSCYHLLSSFLRSSNTYLIPGSYYTRTGFELEDLLTHFFVNFLSPSFTRSLFLRSRCRDK